MAQNQAPPGWYPDPSGSGRQVYWDGTNWAAETPAFPPPPPREVRTYGSQQPSGYQQPSRTNGLAVASLVLGLITLCGLGSLLAIVFGFSALSSIKRDRSQRGRGMAIAGVILGFIGVLIVALVVLGAIVSPKDDNTAKTNSFTSAGGNSPSGAADELDDVTMTSCRSSPAAGLLVIAAGDIVNNSSKSSDYSISVSYVAPDGTILDSSGFAFVQHVPSGGKAKWEARMFTLSIAGASCRVTEVRRIAAH